MASRKKKSKKRSPGTVDVLNDWYIGQVLRLIIPENNSLYETGIPVILIETAMPHFVQHLDMFEYMGTKDVCGNSNHIFKRLNDWDQEFMISPNFFQYFEKRKASKRRMRAPF